MTSLKSAKSGLRSLRNSQRAVLTTASHRTWLVITSHTNVLNRSLGNRHPEPECWTQTSMLLDSPDPSLECLPMFGGGGDISG